MTGMSSMHLLISCHGEAVICIKPLVHIVGTYSPLCLKTKTCNSEQWHLYKTMQILVLVNHHSYTVSQQSTGSFRHCSPIFTATIDVIMEAWGDWQSVSLLGGIMQAWDDGQCVSLGGIIWTKIPLPSVSLSSPPGVQWWKGFGLQVIIWPARPQVKGPTLTGPGRVEFTIVRELI